MEISHLSQIKSVMRWTIRGCIVSPKSLPKFSEQKQWNEQQKQQTIKHLLRRIDNSFYKLKCASLKLQGTAASTGFTKQALYHNFYAPKFAKVSGNFLSEKDCLNIERKLLESHLVTHQTDMITLSKKHTK